MNDKLEPASVIANFGSSDNTALEAMIQKAGEVMRERCACKVDWILAPGGKTQGDAIRALPGVTIGDLK